MMLASMNATSHGAQSSPPGHRAVMGKAATRIASLLLLLLLHSPPTTPPPEKWVWPSRQVQRGLISWTAESGRGHLSGGTS